MGSMLHANRLRAESFGAVAELYDRARPSYPPELVAALLASGAHTRTKPMSANSSYTFEELTRIEQVMSHAVTGLRGYSMQSAAMFLAQEMPHSAGSIYTTYFKLKCDDYAHDGGKPA